MRRFELVEGSSKKYWSIAIQGKNLRVAWGRIGTAGQEQMKPCASPAVAEKEAAALVASKVKKGYVEVKAKAAARKAATAPKAKAAAAVPGVDAMRKKLAVLVPACFEADRELERLTNSGTSWLDEEPMMSFFGTPCSDADIAALEARLDRPLPASYRAYLSLYGDKRTFEFPLGAKQHASK